MKRFIRGLLKRLLHWVLDDQPLDKITCTVNGRKQTVHVEAAVGLSLQVSTLDGSQHVIDASNCEDVDHFNRIMKHALSQNSQKITWEDGTPYNL